MVENENGNEIEKEEDVDKSFPGPGVPIHYFELESLTDLAKLAFVLKAKYIYKNELKHDIEADKFKIKGKHSYIIPASG